MAIKLSSGNQNPAQRKHTAQSNDAPLTRQNGSPRNQQASFDMASMVATETLSTDKRDMSVAKQQPVIAQNMYRSPTIKCRLPMTMLANEHLSVAEPSRAMSILKSTMLRGSTNHLLLGGIVR
jgi:hypothetical protein